MSVGLVLEVCCPGSCHVQNNLNKGERSGAGRNCSCLSVTFTESNICCVVQGEIWKEEREGGRDSK